MGDRRTSRRSRATGIVVPLAALWLCGCAPSEELEAPIARAEDLREVDSPVLIRALESGPSELRARAALAMGRIQEPGYAEPLARASAADDLAVRRAALFALGQLGLAEGARPEQVAVDACVAAAGDDDPRIAADALQALGKLAPEGIAATITPFLTHADGQVREQAAHALFRLRFVPVWRRQAEQPPPLPDASVRALIRALADESAAVRRAAAHAFSRYGQPEALEALAEATRDPDEWVRVFAVRAIGRSGQGNSLATLLAAAGDDSPHVRTEIVNAIAALGRADELPSRLAADPSFHVRAAVARALGSAQGEASLTRLRELERDPSATVAAAAIESLAARRADAYAGQLAEHLADERWTIRMAAARGALQLERGQSELLASARSDAVNSVRLAAFEVLAGLDGGEEILLEGLRSEDLAMRGTAVGLLAQSDAPQRVNQLLETYHASTGDKWVEVRESIVDALAADGDSEATREILREMALGDSAGSVRRRAAVVLAGWGVETSAAEPEAREVSPFLGRRLEADPIVVLETDRGEMRLRCLSGAAPIHVASFVERVGAGFYDGLLWHRVVANFVIQGGDPRGDGWGGAGYLLRDEINRVPYERGTVGMPKAGKDTGGGQIFITHLPTPHLDGNYTVFAEVIDGEEVIDRTEVGDRIVRARVVGHASE